MVRENADEEGIGIWEIQNYRKLEDLLEDLIQNGISSQDHIEPSNISVEEILVIGSYGSGLGIPQESDLDIVVFVMYSGDIRSNEYSECMKEIAGAINFGKDKIISEFSQFVDVEAYVFPFLERQQHLAELAQNSSVDHYYDLTKDEQRSYYGYV